MRNDKYLEYAERNPTRFQRRFDPGLRGVPIFHGFLAQRFAFIQEARRGLGLSARICDVGAGTGLTSLMFRELLSDQDFIVSVDFSQYLLTRCDGTSRICGDAAKLPFAYGTFDLAYGMNVLHHVVDLDGAVREMLRISKGPVVMIEPNRRNPLYFVFALVNREERGLLKVGHRSMLARCGTRGTRLRWIEPLPFHLGLMKTPYAWVSRLLGRLGFETFFAAYVLTVEPEADSRGNGRARGSVAASP